jgi:NTP pyrophosphatase (non-canonical NTP hydrolase)
MDTKQYVQLAMRTRCPQGEVIHERLRQAGTTADKVLHTQLLHSCIGLAGEGGELMTAVQRWLYYGKGLDLTNIKEELGDALWYIAEACEAMGCSMAELMEANINKLSRRYPEKFTEHLAAEENRNRASEREAIEQMGNGFAEPAEEQEYPAGGDERVEQITRRMITKALCGHGNQQPIQPNAHHDYPWMCTGCGIAPVHKSNVARVCPDCFNKNGKNILPAVEHTDARSS